MFASSSGRISGISVATIEQPSLYRMRDSRPQPAPNSNHRLQRAGADAVEEDEAEEGAGGVQPKVRTGGW